MNNLCAGKRQNPAASYDFDFEIEDEDDFE